MVGGPQLLIILLIIVVLFGGAKLPQLARSVGQAQKEFNKGLKEGGRDDDDDEPLSDSEREELKRLRNKADSKDS